MTDKIEIAHSAASGAGEILDERIYLIRLELY